MKWILISCLLLTACSSDLDRQTDLIQKAKHEEQIARGFLDSARQAHEAGDTINQWRLADSTEAHLRIARGYANKFHEEFNR